MKGKTRTELALPPLDAAQHIAEHLFQIGPSTSGEVVTYQEIQAWKNLTGHELNGWEAQTIRALSAAYLAEYQAAEDAKRPAPYSPDARLVSREEVSSRILAAFMRLAGGDGATSY